MEEVFWPLRLIILGAGFDYLDGYFARKSKQDSRIGSYMDTIADEITYVLLPSFWLFFITSQIEPPNFALVMTTNMIAFLYLSCGSFRLIRFLKDPIDNYFEGLPASVAALIVGALNVVIIASPSESGFFFELGFHTNLFLILISILMITHLKYPSHKSYSQLYNVFRIMGYLLIGTFVIFPVLWLSFGIFIFFVLYTLTGPYYTSKLKL